MSWLLWSGLLLGGLVVLAVTLSVYGAHRWRRDMRASVRELFAESVEGGRGATRYDPSELDGLPAPVQRYFRTVLKEGQPIISAVSIAITGRFNLSPTGEQWKPFESTQQIVTRRPGFVWDARIGMAPGLNVYVVDRYCAGEGLLHASLLGLLPMAHLAGDGEIARGELMRWFAEAPWYPSALLPSQGVRWEALDAQSAHATVVDGPITLTLLFRFNEAGLIDSIYAQERGSMVGKTMVMAPWEGRWSDYRLHAGMLLPFTGEVAWIRPEGRKSYFVGTVQAMEHQYCTG